MPFNSSKTNSFTEVELLRFPVGIHAVKSVVLDATDVASWPAPTAADYLSGNSRFLVPSGTILALSATNTNEYIKYAGGAVGVIKGILGRGVDMVANATNSDEPAPMFFHECVFATEGIVGFTLYASALINDLKTCLFQ